ncbi:MAG: protein kinase [Rhodobacteraceae bacterium]|nr:protein kinase [Paracoccaceae bacterium]
MELPEYIGRYVVRREIARGGFAVVALAWDEELTAEVAIKILLLHDEKDMNLKQRFIEEARLLRRMKSYNIVGIHDVGRLSDGSPYFVMDYADLGTLANRLQARRKEGAGLPQQDILQLVDALSSGLSAIHRAGIVHRDVKPDNILYQTIGTRLPQETIASGCQNLTVAMPLPGDQQFLLERVMIGDLGIARDLSSDNQSSLLLGGTPAYMAPEQFEADGGVNRAVDIYSASAVLWYALTGARPPDSAFVASEIELQEKPWRDFFLLGMALDPVRRFDDIQAWSSAAHDVMAQIAAKMPDPTIARHDGNALPTPGADCPYRGLSAFQPEDADRFFGREELVADLLQRLKSSKVLVVGGSSGSGKSSLIRAGLISSLRQGSITGSEGWRIELFTPGTDALSELFFRLRGNQENARVRLDEFVARPSIARQVLLDAGSEPLLLAIDQFEELFTLNAPEVTQDFVDALAALTDPADSKVRVVITIRADFYQNCAAVPWLAEAVSRNQVLVGPMTARDLRRAIVEPARRAGIYVEQHLVDAIVSEAGNDAGVLPLISHALVETWVRRLGATLTYEGYRGSGGMAGAIRQTADVVFDNDFSDDERRVAERLLLNLVTPGEGGADARRVLARSELKGDRDAPVMERVVKRLTEARLLTIDDETVQITHEALLRSWPRLSRWIERSRGDLRLRLRIVQMAEEWIEAGRDFEMLLRGARLEYVLEWFENNQDKAGAKEREFLEAGSMAQEAAQKEANNRRAQRHRLQFAAVGTLAALAIGATAASVIALKQSRHAQANAAIADAATIRANDSFASALSAAAAGYATDDPLLALNLAVQSISRSRSPQTTFDARVALLRARLILSKGAPAPMGALVPARDALSIAISPDGGSVVTGGRDGMVRILDTATRHQVAEELVSDIGGVQDIAFSPHGDGFAAVGDSGRIVFWPYSGGFAEEPWLLGETSDILWRMAFHPNDPTIATVGEDGRVRIWSISDRGGADGRIIATRNGDFTSVAFSPNGRALAAGTGAGEVWAWQYPAGEALFPPLTTLHSSDVWGLSFSDDGALLATVSSDGSSAIVEIGSGKPVGRAFAATETIGAVEFMSDGWRLVGGNAEGRLSIWDVKNQELEARSPSGHTGRILDIALSDNQRIAATLGADQQVRFWRLGPKVPLSKDYRLTNGAQIKGLALGNNHLAVGDTNGSISVSEFAENSTVSTMPLHRHQVWAVALSPDGKRLATADRNGQIVISSTDFAGAQVNLSPIGEAIWSLNFSSDGTKLLVAAESAAHLIDLETKNTIRLFKPERGSVTRAAMDFGASKVALSTSRGQVHIWSLAEEAEPTILDVSNNLVWSVSFSKDGSLLAAADSDEIVSIWKLPNGERLKDFTGHVRGATDVLILGDGATLVASDRRGGLHIWDMTYGKLVGNIPNAHTASIWRLAAHPDGQKFASSGDDGVVRVWDVLSTQAACELSKGVLGLQQRAQYLGATDAIDACTISETK